MNIQIGSQHIGEGHPPFIIAELSGNHNQSLERALSIVEAAAEAGVNALKLQTYTPDTMTIDLPTGPFLVDDPGSLWYGKSLYELYKTAYTPWEWHKPIFDRCKELGIIGFSTPFDSSAVDFLESLKVPCYKISSFENVDIPLIEKVASTNKPVIISTGMAAVPELEEIVKTVREKGNNDLILLKCTSSYPATPLNTNLQTIPHMRDQFGCQVGLSDHTLGIGVAIASVAFGASIIEKHFTLRRSDGGVDSAFSIEPSEMHSLVQESKKAWQAIGGIRYGAIDEEKKSLRYRRSLYAISDIKAGDSFSPENFRSIRPGYGLHPRYYNEIIGRKAKYNVKKGDPLTWSLIE